jgi:glucan phosphoethanolaminetransferase (alkaline phosphatase superfamily)
VFHRLKPILNGISLFLSLLTLGILFSYSTFIFSSDGQNVHSILTSQITHYAWTHSKPAGAGLIFFGLLVMLKEFIYRPQNPSIKLLINALALIISLILVSSLMDIQTIARLQD